jgi:replication-associated recombination protein RarA
MKDVVTLDLTLELTSKLTHFKEYAVSHPQLLQVDKVLMQAIQEPAGFAHVLIYGPSGVGKTTMIRQISRRLNEILPAAAIVGVASSKKLNSQLAQGLDRSPSV